MVALEVRPWERWFRQEFALPSGDFGPVLFCEFCWLAVSLFTFIIKGVPGGLVVKSFVYNEKVLSSVKINPLRFNYQGALQHLGVSRGHVFSQYPDKYELDRGKEEETDRNGCNTDGETVPEQELIDEIA